MPTAAELLTELDACPVGRPGWQQFEEAARAILEHGLVPPLQAPHIQPRSLSGIDRRDAIFPNREMTPDTIWGKLYCELAARMILVEFKNYDTLDVGKAEVDQTRNYLTRTIGRFGIICCRRPPDGQALLRRNQVFTQDQKVIVFLDEAKLRELVHMKERGDDPSLLIMEQVEMFYIQYE